MKMEGVVVRSCAERKTRREKHPYSFSSGMRSIRRT